ncbi:MAG: response regulator transcription factor [Chloroflexi bacterium]|nr:response regulator transcription factor [Chloroflexota bacterium]
MSSTISILIIDDEANLRASLAMILQRAGYRVSAAANAYQALDYLRAGAFDLAFLDIRMPEMDGMTLLPEIRKQYPNMPVLILTANATLETAIGAVRKGARDYLIKPVDPAKILARVQEIIAESERPRRRRELVGAIQSLVEELDTLEAPASLLANHERTRASNNDAARTVRRGPFVLDIHSRRCIFQGETIALSPTAFDYLVTLVRHSPNPISYETLVHESQGYKPTPLEAREIARWRIHELRKAIEGDTKQPRYLITVRGAGYRLVTDEV